MRLSKLIPAAALAATLGAALPAARADNVPQDLKTVARTTAAKAGKAVVTVKLVVKFTSVGTKTLRAKYARLELV